MTGRPRHTPTSHSSPVTAGARTPPVCSMSSNQSTSVRSVGRITPPAATCQGIFKINEPVICGCFVFYKIFDVKTQADPPESEHEHSQEVPGVREDVRQHARPLHARPHSQPQPQVQHLWEGVLQTLASEGSPQVTRI